MRSRVTLASTDAAAMHTLLASPLTMASALPLSGSGILFPSMSAQSASSPSPLTAPAMASIVASRMLISSMRWWSMIHTHLMTSGLAISASNATSRSSSVICLLSLMASMFKSGGKIHAAATTGPARGPRPASSTPHTAFIPWSQYICSCSRVGPAFRGFLAAFAASAAVDSPAAGFRLRVDFPREAGFLSTVGGSNLMSSAMTIPFLIHAPRPTCLVTAASFAFLGAMPREAEGIEERWREGGIAWCSAEVAPA
mmetsp:Transcript_30194/g.75665  ORF Transcript_30194/g.75665 Transcript_30194/m.75665 type:complete len:255 (+) Transcript_30194:228-992(+)